MTGKHEEMEIRIAIVSGGARGIGLAIVNRLREEGCFVISLDRDHEIALPSIERATRGGKVQWHADISDEQSVKDVFNELSAKYGRLDILVNNAGIVRDRVIWKMEAEEFDAVLNLNLRGTWLMCRAAARIMKTQQSGHIVNISSRAWLGNPGQSNYAPSKAGVVALTRVLALELGRYGVIVNAVAPGLIDTPLTRGLSDDVLSKLIAAQPTRSMGTPDDVAQAVVFLSGKSNRFITGQNL